MSGAPAHEHRHRAQRPGRLHVTRVRRVHRVTPRMARITFASEDLTRFLSNGTDQHVAMYFYEPWVVLPRPFTTEAARELLSRARPRLRRYTIRSHRPEMGEVDMDFVLHGGDQLASGWAEKAAPDDEAIWFGPSPAYPLDQEQDWTVLIGDETALPAIAVMLEQLPGNHPVQALIEVADADEELPLTTGIDARVTWLHRGRRPHGRLLLEHATRLKLPGGSGRVWGAAERSVVRELRRHFVRDRGLDRAATHLTAYWTKGETQDSEV
ncbi:siderophore-interacting protein [Streptomyces sp. HNM0575]|uniref:siderophore-interacting protein n=1 Tax=Streptomyces sp. HNM0575 TaxID=2716338 RepID=UPI00145D0FCF|nr:siderophore-interacting protein [Streptomyces sp. HNM0575]NLU73388.1 siderophore-interacting protein [Streptomyces sp. HNM0575]